MRKCYIVGGLLFGDECKGATTDWLVRFEGASLVVRYNGGPQNSHNVVLPDGRYHTFRQFGSGTFVEGVRTHLTEHVLINPTAMIIENHLLETMGVHDAFNRLTIESEAVVITPYQRAINVLQEVVRGSSAHGTCGVGLGRAREDSLAHSDRILRAGHLKSKDEVMKRLKFIEEVHCGTASLLYERIRKMPEIKQEDPEVVDAIAWFNNGASREYLWSEYQKFPLHTILPSNDWRLRNILMSKDDVIVFEGSQGALLDENNKDYYPHVTWTDTTFGNAIGVISRSMSKDLKLPNIIRVGCLRPYATRHGAGPLPREDADLTLWMRKHCSSTEVNVPNRFQGKLRYGFLDLGVVKKAIDTMGPFGGVDQIAMSCMDHLFSAEGFKYYDKSGNRVSVPHSCNVGMHSSLTGHIQKEIGVPITLLGYGPTYTDRFLRMTD